MSRHGVSQDEVDLKAAIGELQAESMIRKLMARYAMLCDIPLPLPDLDLEGRLREILALFWEGARWEGVGQSYVNQFGSCVGHAEIGAHFRRFFEQQSPQRILNCHYVTGEQIYVDGDVATGQWVQFQPWVFDDGTSVIRSSRLNNVFRRIDGVWKLSRYRTENVLAAPLPKGAIESFTRESVLFR